MGKIIDIYAYSYGNAAQNYGAEQGPEIIRKALKRKADQFHWYGPFSIENHKQQLDALQDVVTLSQLLSKQVLRSVLHNHFFITLGGDHSCAIGSWSGAAAAIQNHGDLGLIWFDAHMDAHTHQSTITNNIHGMPLAALLGHGLPELTHILSTQPKLKPENVALIGTRSYESGEAALLKRLNVKLFDMQDIATRGLASVIEEAVQVVTKNTYRFGISIDLDGFDPLEAPGVGTPEVNGINAKEFLANLFAIAGHKNFIGMDIAEFNPSLDQDHKTESLIISLIDASTKACRLRTSEPQS
ncbi:MAG: hypothetical protein A3E84_03565 [Gammaproteobacteria bacterium RIFCSPHIGHO2_12_FULL_42_13]|nr:MAG: hypothetical protein A3E84_03565 [Gammaproteobacteria bacterium RIFCSPHIGHO2_12_FULL_42_13]